MGSSAVVAGVVAAGAEVAWISLIGIAVVIVLAVPGVNLKPAIVAPVAIVIAAADRQPEVVHHDVVGAGVRDVVGAQCRVLLRVHVVLPDLCPTEVEATHPEEHPVLLMVDAVRGEYRRGDTPRVGHFVPSHLSPIVVQGLCHFFRKNQGCVADRDYGVILIGGEGILQDVGARRDRHCRSQVVSDALAVVHPEPCQIHRRRQTAEPREESRPCEGLDPRPIAAG